MLLAATILRLPHIHGAHDANGYEEIETPKCDIFRQNASQRLGKYTLTRHER